MRCTFIIIFQKLSKVMIEFFGGTFIHVIHVLNNLRLAAASDMEYSAISLTFQNKRNQTEPTIFTLFSCCFFFSVEIANFFRLCVFDR
jgi:hypothetical protein